MARGNKTPRPRLTTEEYANLLEFRARNKKRPFNEQPAYGVSLSPEEYDALMARREKPKHKEETNDDGPFLDVAENEDATQEGGPFVKGYTEHASPTVVRNKNLGFISDLHIPVHDATACNVAISDLKDKGITGLIIGGDALDMYSLTRHGKDSRKYGLQYELNTARRELKNLRRFVGDSMPIYYIEGNHEMWWKKYMRNIAKELDEYQSLSDVLGLRALGMEYLDHGMGIKAGKLHIIHGHEIAGAGKYVANRKLMKAKANIIFGHHHTTQEWSETNLDGEELGSWAVGCLCQRTPEWLRFNEWNQGFARIEFDDSGAFTVENNRIIHGKIH